MDRRFKVAVLVECHPYDIVNFQKMLWSFEDCDCYVQPFDLFIQDAENRDSYDTVLYYSMSLPLPEEGSDRYRYMVQELGNTKQGIILMHHALLSFPRWDIYTEVSGVKVRCEEQFQFHQNERVDQYIVDKGHPVMNGIDKFTLIDETYEIGEPEEPGNTILIETDNPSGMDKIAWTRRYKNSRVFCYASGHDNNVYGNENFRRIMHQAIHWTAGEY